MVDEVVELWGGQCSLKLVVGRQRQMGRRDSIWGRADMPMCAGNMASNRIGIPYVGENESAREGIPAGAILRLSSYQ